MAPKKNISFGVTLDPTTLAMLDLHAKATNATRSAAVKSMVHFVERMQQTVYEGRIDTPDYAELAETAQIDFQRACVENDRIAELLRQADVDFATVVSLNEILMNDYASLLTKHRELKSKLDTKGFAVFDTENPPEKARVVAEAIGTEIPAEAGYFEKDPDDFLNNVSGARVQSNVSVHELEEDRKPHGGFLSFLRR